MKPLNKLLAIRVRATGLKCDWCDYRENDVELNRKNVIANLNRPCPQCGANLLTKADAEVVLAHLRAARIMNILFFIPLLVLYPFRRLFNMRYMRLRGEMHGTGEIKYTRKEDITD